MADDGTTKVQLVHVHVTVKPQGFTAPERQASLDVLFEKEDAMRLMLALALLGAVLTVAPLVSIAAPETLTVACSGTDYKGS